VIGKQKLTYYYIFKTREKKNGEGKGKEKKDHWYPNQKIKRLVGHAYDDSNFFGLGLFRWF